MKNAGDFHNEEKLNFVAIVREVFDLNLFAVICSCDMYWILAQLDSVRYWTYNQAHDKGCDSIVVNPNCTIIIYTV